MTMKRTDFFFFNIHLVKLVVKVLEITATTEWHNSKRLVLPWQSLLGPTV